MDKIENLKELLKVQEKMNRLFKEVTQPLALDTNTSWLPLVDIYETKESLVLKVDLPDIDQNDIKVNIDGEKLTISGQRSLPKGIEAEQFHRQERFYGEFLRHLVLPYNIDQDNVDANYKNGVLTITMPKITPKVARQIMVKVD
jgi:HSP20 family protein